METPAFSHAACIASQNPLNLDFAAYRSTLLSLMIKDEVYADREHVHAAEQLRRKHRTLRYAPGDSCLQRYVRYLYQVLRGFSPETGLRSDIARF